MNDLDKLSKSLDRALEKDTIGGIFEHIKKAKDHLPTIQKKIEKLEHNLKEYKQTFDLRWEADMRAIKMWQTDTGKLDQWPDHTEMVLYLMEKLEKND